MGYYDPLLAFLESSVRHSFMSDWQMDLIRVDKDASALLERADRGCCHGLTTHQFVPDLTARQAV